MLQPKPTVPQKLCNCLVKEDCPMNGLFLTAIVLYEAILKCSDSKYKQKRCKGISVTRHSRNATQTTKNHSTLLSLKMTPYYL